MNIANMMTIARVVMVPIIAWLVYMATTTGSATYTWLALITFVLAAITDWADGYFARKYDQVTEFGALWDPIADKGLVLGTLAVLAWFGQMAWWVVLLFAVREIGMTLWRMWIVKTGGKVVSARPWGKWKTATQLVGISLMLTPILPIYWGQWLVYVALALTYVSAGDLLVSYYKPMSS
ncbi:CDP-diacylglycerol--glycerol-3-phosphate 3-phosphatidyltransferase [Stomatohabitans albus]|uniref:CDP-diacylglycerol--glycerol-3-phosphate 3-phosphatidyltransferase n=1 Tax=Stomatohabitans albus TaxID=3110766 RepID=UPI00300CA6D3